MPFTRTVPPARCLRPGHDNAHVVGNGTYEASMNIVSLAVRVPLGELAPGLYVVHVEARSSASSTPAGVGRDVVIRVR